MQAAVMAAQAPGVLLLTPSEMQARLDAFQTASKMPSDACRRLVATKPTLLLHSTEVIQKAAAHARI